METRNFCNMHFILAIRGAVVKKVRNIDSSGKPSLVFKELADIYKSDGVKILSTSSGLKSEDDDLDFALGCNRVVESKTTSGDNHYDFDETIGEPDDLIFDNMTLNQLKEGHKTRKRKFTNSVGLPPKLDCAESQLEEDDFKACTDLQVQEDDLDLGETLSNWKKLSKCLKAKRKSLNKSVSTSCKVIISPKSKCNLSAQDCQQSRRDLPASVRIKVEAPKYQGLNSMAEDSSMNCNEQLDLCGGECSEIPRNVGSILEKEEAMSFKGECKSCVPNEASDEYQECKNPSSTKTNGEETMEMNNLQLTCQQSSILSTSEFKERVNIQQQSSLIESALETTSPPDLDMDSCDSSQTSFLPEISGQMSNDSKVQLFGTPIENGLLCMELKYGHDLETFVDDGHPALPSNSHNNSSARPVGNCDSLCNSTSGPNNDLIFEMDNAAMNNDNRLLASIVSDATTTCLNPDYELVILEENSPAMEERLTLDTLSADTERVSSNKSHPCPTANGISTSEISVSNSSKEQQTPERLLSRRKAISPSSQEKLCLAMNSIELYDDADHQKCKGKICSDKQGNKESPQGLKSKVTKLKTNTDGSGGINQIKVTTIPKQIFKRRRTIRDGCPLGASVEGPNCRSLPRFSTGCSSIQGCSESAIEFSRRQMNDFESIAMKLLTELKSMKNIVEGKLLYEAYRHNFLRHDALEVKNVINNATKTEEKATKWLSIMARDCKRFCKIMKLTQNGETGVEIDSQHERKKITFADETGGALCHVKLFEDCTPESEIVNSIVQEE